MEELVTRDCNLERGCPGEQFLDREPTEAEYDELVRQGLATSRLPNLQGLLKRKKKHADCASVVGKEHCDLLEDEDLKMSGLIKTRAAEVDPGALVVRGESVGWRNNSSGGFTVTVGKRRADFWWLMDGFVNLILLDAETGKRYTSTERSIGTLPYEDAMQVAQDWLSGTNEGFMELEASNVIFRERRILAEKTTSGHTSTGGNTMLNFPIPQAEYANQKSDCNVTPNLRAMLRANEGLDFSAPVPARAPLVQRSTPVAPAATGGLTMAQINQAVQVALAPLYSDIAQLKASRGMVTRTRRRAVAPQVSRESVRAAMGLEPQLVQRTVESSILGQPPSRRPVFSAQEVSRRSYGLPMVTRTADQPAAFKSRYQPTSQFPTRVARDRYDLQFENLPQGVPLPPGAVERALAEFPISRAL